MSGDSYDSLVEYLAHEFGRVLGLGYGFVLFVDDLYLSNAERSGVAAALIEWKTKARAGGAGNAGEATDARRARLGFERRCVEIYDAIHKSLPGIPLAIFVFNFGEGGHIAHKFSDAKDALSRIDSFLREHGPS